MYSFATPNSSKLMTLSLGLTHTHTILMVNAAYDVSPVAHFPHGVVQELP